MAVPAVHVGLRRRGRRLGGGFRIRRANGTGTVYVRPGIRVRGDLAGCGSSHEAAEVHQEQADHRLYPASRRMLMQPVYRALGPYKGAAARPMMRRPIWL